MNQSAIYKMQGEDFQRTPKRETPPIYVSVRAGNAACPAIDMSMLKTTADQLQTTMEELDGACG